jgi:acrylyl-CoA reductase (NADPH)/3-hydroxypropionyl-CoA dehydratase/3-hydroxypropionyl-CoA synthetase
VEALVHLQFKHRQARGFGMIVTEDEYWGLRNLIWNIDKRIFWGAVGKRLLHLFEAATDQWLIFDDHSRQWVGYDATDFHPVAAPFPPDWTPWERVLNDDEPPHFKWFEGAQTNLSFNALDRFILQHPEPHNYRYWEDESWGEDAPRETLRWHHREYLFEVTKVVMALNRLGVTRRDRVALLMPEIPEAYFLIEAFHRMGIVYTSLPTSLGHQQVSDRIDNLGVKFVFTVNGGWHKGKPVFYKADLLDRSLEDFARRETVRHLLETSLEGRGRADLEELLSAFEARFENKLTIKKMDLGRFLDGYGLSGDLVRGAMQSLDAEPARVSTVIVCPRIPGHEAPMKTGRDKSWFAPAFMKGDEEGRILSAAAESLGRELGRSDLLDYRKVSPPDFLKVIHQFAPPAILEADHPRLVIYTSGSTGIPKGVVHRTLGHALFGMYTMLVTMGPRPWDIMDTRATHSWITGLDYIAGMPGLLGVESIVAEGAFDYGRWFRRLAGLKVDIAKAGAPVLRGIKRFLESEAGSRVVNTSDLSSVRVCVNCAEPADPVTQKVVNELLGENTYVNTWWPTELSGPNTGAGSAHVPFAYAMRQDASTFPLPYVKQDVLEDEVDSDDNVVHVRPQDPGFLGRYVIDPHPGMLMGIYGDPEKFREAYFERYWQKTGNQIWYDSGDGAIRHEDGYFHIIGRVGYGFNWRGHISGAEDVEGTLRDHPAVRDIMIAPVKTEEENLDRLQVFLVLNEGYRPDEALKREFDAFVVQKKQRTFKGLMTQGADYYVVDMYPVTMSQKSLRRFGALMGSLTDRELMEIIGELEDPETRARVEAGDEAAIARVFPTRKDQNPHAGSLVGLGNYPSLPHLAYAVARARGLIS